MNIIQLIQAIVSRLPYADGTFQAIVFSPPYWSLRDYQTAEWIGGDPKCKHSAGVRDSICRICGAVRRDDQFGLEEVHDCGAWMATGFLMREIGILENRRPKAIRARVRTRRPIPKPCGKCFVCHTVAYMREVRRVLREDGVVYMVIGDTYNGSGGAGGDYYPGGIREGQPRYKGARSAGLKAKDLTGIPWRVALALQADGWWVRSESIWNKPNPMPESAGDRPGRTHETIFMFSKSPRYFWDMDAVREVANYDGRKKLSHDGSEKYQDSAIPEDDKAQTFAGGMHSRWPNFTLTGEKGRNLRTVWTIPTQPYKGSHYATFPERLVEICLKSATSEKGACPTCGAPWKRVIQKTGGTVGKGWHNHKDDWINGQSKAIVSTKEDDYKITIEGWLPSCSCYGIERPPDPPEMPDDAEEPEYCQFCGGIGIVDAGPLFPDGLTCEKCAGEGITKNGNKVWRDWKAEVDRINSERIELLGHIDRNAKTVPCIVLDPFSGSGTTVAVAKRLGLSAIGSDLSYKYLTKNAKKRVRTDQPTLF